MLQLQQQLLQPLRVKQSVLLLRMQPIKLMQLKQPAKSYADGLIATEVTNRNTAISTAVSAEATLRASADTALQGRADTLEQKTTGITYTPSGSNLGGIGDISGVSVRMTSATTYEWSADGTTWIPGSSSDFGQDAPLQGSSLDAIKVATRFVGTQAAKTTVTGDLVCYR